MGGIPSTRRKGKTGGGGRKKNEEKEEGRNRVDSDSSSTGHKTFSFCSLPLLLPLHLRIKGLVNKNKRPDEDFPRELWTTAQHAFISGQLPRLTLKCFTPSRDQCSRECFWMSLVLVKLSIHNQPRYLGDAHCDTNLSRGAAAPNDDRLLHLRPGPHPFAHLHDKHTPLRTVPRTILVHLFHRLTERKVRTPRSALRSVPAWPGVKWYSTKECKWGETHFGWEPWKYTLIQGTNCNLWGITNSPQQICPNCGRKCMVEFGQA